MTFPCLNTFFIFHYPLHVGFLTHAVFCLVFDSAYITSLSHVNTLRLIKKKEYLRQVFPLTTKNDSKDMYSKCR